MTMERSVFVNTVEYDVPVDPMDDLQCDSCQ
ncbi:ribonucleotide-diphosphate reductase subunit beta [Antiquaquibacter soli]|uniref:Ribonucleotide-diphosphate reductase subunit beta n=1 Tax=Antiquaquibacter soli TaxID=3064523 RepID=A0ABT9BRN7_9MICO|nr:ribonucleotide-diphosphate reductase subunit beta [Protaetiibacter sp. WY-16]MDO7883604.1 ribonucleotide-diphosphate reductase subunit beta [Protaetiibacter sp. WY-16]